MAHRVQRLCLAFLTVPCLILAGCPAGGGGGGGGTVGLTLNASVLDFGVADTQESFTIRNTGNGTLSWTAAVAYMNQDFTAVVDSPDWLSLSAVGGTVSTETVRIDLVAYRAVLGTTSATYNALITVTDGSVSREVRVSIAVLPDAGGGGGGGGGVGSGALGVSVSTISLACPNDDEATFNVTNNGTASLTWTIALFIDGDPVAFNDSIDVSRRDGGTILAGGTTPVTLTVDCGDLEFISNKSFELRITSGTDTKTVTVSLDGTGVIPELTVSPTTLDYGTDLTELTFDISNTGPIGTSLQFAVNNISGTSGAPIIPTTGIVPTAGVILSSGDPSSDRTTVTVSIDRSALTQDSAERTLEVSAPGVSPVEVRVLVVKAPLRIEGSVNQARPPSIQRFVFTLRDPVGNVIPTISTAERALIQFLVDEDGEPLDLDESNLFIEGPENLRQNVVLVLDYTGSMQNGSAGGGRLIEDMKTAAQLLISHLPSRFRLSIMEHHDAPGGYSLLHGFSTDKVSLAASITNFNLDPGQHGASALYDVLDVAVNALRDEDIGSLPFDDADVRAIITIGDGQVFGSTVSKGEVLGNATSPESRARIFPVAFGEAIKSNVLVELANETGGHLYSAKGRTELLSLMAVETTPGSIWSDLKNQIVVRYLSQLGPASTGTYLITGRYRESATSIVEGFFERDAVVARGDSRAGQISLITEGIDVAGNVDVFVRVDYAPRNVSSLRLRFFVDPFMEIPIDRRPALRSAFVDNAGTPKYTVSLITDGGPIDSSWHRAPEPAAELPGKGVNFVERIVATSDNAMSYGSSGVVLKVSISGLSGFVGEMIAAGLIPDFQLGVRVDNRDYPLGEPPYPFFEYPGGRLNPLGILTVGLTPAIAAPAVSVLDLVDNSFDPTGNNAFNQDGIDPNEPGIDDFDDRRPNDPLFD